MRHIDVSSWAGHHGHMSDGAQVLGWLVDGQEAAGVAARLLAWLVERGIVEATPTDSGLSVLAHRPGPRALEAVVGQKPRTLDFRKLLVNGVECSYAMQARFLSDGDEMPEFDCPGCGASLETDAVMERLGELDNPFQTPPRVDCPGCSKSFALTELRVSSGAFANVVLRFWNWWPLKAELIAELRQIGGDRVAVLHERI